MDLIARRMFGLTRQGQHRTARAGAESAVYDCVVDCDDVEVGT